ncbi:MAG: hypothetical protein ACYCO3_10180 [Mycobacteriales bacterium]
MAGAPTHKSRLDYRRRRKELLQAMLCAHGDDLDNAVDELGRFFDHLRQVTIRGLFAEKANDRDYVFDTIPSAGRRLSRACARWTPPPGLRSGKPRRSKASPSVPSHLERVDRCGREVGAHSVRGASRSGRPAEGERLTSAR